MNKNNSTIDTTTAATTTDKQRRKPTNKRTTQPTSASATITTSTASNKSKSNSNSIAKRNSTQAEQVKHMIEQQQQKYSIPAARPSTQPPMSQQSHASRYQPPPLTTEFWPPPVASKLLTNEGRLALSKSMYFKDIFQTSLPHTASHSEYLSYVPLRTSYMHNAATHVGTIPTTTKTEEDANRTRSTPFPATTTITTQTKVMSTIPDSQYQSIRSHSTCSDKQTQTAPDMIASNRISNRFDLKSSTEGVHSLNMQGYQEARGRMQFTDEALKQYQNTIQKSSKNTHKKSKKQQPKQQEQTLNSKRHKKTDDQQCTCPPKTHEHHHISTQSNFNNNSMSDSSDYSNSSYSSLVSSASDNSSPSSSSSDELVSSKYCTKRCQKHKNQRRHPHKDHRNHHNLDRYSLKSPKATAAAAVSTAYTCTCHTETIPTLPTAKNNNSKQSVQTVPTTSNQTCPRCSQINNNNDRNDYLRTAPDKFSSTLKNAYYNTNQEQYHSFHSQASPKYSNLYPSSQGQNSQQPQLKQSSSLHAYYSHVAQSNNALSATNKATSIEKERFAAMQDQINSLFLEVSNLKAYSNGNKMNQLFSSNSTSTLLTQKLSQMRQSTPSTLLHLQSPSSFASGSVRSNAAEYNFLSLANSKRHSQPIQSNLKLLDLSSNLNSNNKYNSNSNNNNNNSSRSLAQNNTPAIHQLQQQQYDSEQLPQFNQSKDLIESKRVLLQKNAEQKKLIEQQISQSEASPTSSSNAMNLARRMSSKGQLKDKFKEIEQIVSLSQQKQKNNLEQFQQKQEELQRALTVPPSPQSKSSSNYQRVAGNSVQQQLFSEHIKNIDTVSGDQSETNYHGAQQGQQQIPRPNSLVNEQLLLVEQPNNHQRSAAKNDKEIQPGYQYGQNGINVHQQQPNNALQAVPDSQLHRNIQRIEQDKLYSSSSQQVNNQHDGDSFANYVNGQSALRNNTSHSSSQPTIRQFEPSNNPNNIQQVNQGILNQQISNSGSLPQQQQITRQQQLQQHQSLSQQPQQQLQQSQYQQQEQSWVGATSSVDYEPFDMQRSRSEQNRESKSQQSVIPSQQSIHMQQKSQQMSSQNNNANEQSQQLEPYQINSANQMRSVQPIQSAQQQPSPMVAVHQSTDPFAGQQKNTIAYSQQQHEQQYLQQQLQPESMYSSQNRPTNEGEENLQRSKTQSQMESSQKIAQMNYSTPNFMSFHQPQQSRPDSTTMAKQALQSQYFVQSKLVQPPQSMDSIKQPTHQTNSYNSISRASDSSAGTALQQQQLMQQSMRSQPSKESLLQDVKDLLRLKQKSKEQQANATATAAASEVASNQLYTREEEQQYSPENVRQQRQYLSASQATNQELTSSNPQPISRSQLLSANNSQMQQQLQQSTGNIKVSDLIANSTQQNVQSSSNRNIPAFTSTLTNIQYQEEPMQIFKPSSHTEVHPQMQQSMNSLQNYQALPAVASRNPQTSAAVVEAVAADPLDSLLFGPTFEVLPLLDEQLYHNQQPQQQHRPLNNQPMVLMNNDQQQQVLLLQQQQQQLLQRQQQQQLMQQQQQQQLDLYQQQQQYLQQQQQLRLANQPISKDSQEMQTIRSPYPRDTAADTAQSTNQSPYTAMETPLRTIQPMTAATVSNSVGMFPSPPSASDRTYTQQQQLLQQQQYFTPNVIASRPQRSALQVSPSDVLADNVSPILLATSTSNQQLSKREMYLDPDYDEEEMLAFDNYLSNISSSGHPHKRNTEREYEFNYNPNSSNFLNHNQNQPNNHIQDPNKSHQQQYPIKPPPAWQQKQSIEIQSLKQPASVPSAKSKGSSYKAVRDKKQEYMKIASEFDKALPPVARFYNVKGSSEKQLVRSPNDFAGANEPFNNQNSSGGSQIVHGNNNSYKADSASLITKRSSIHKQQSAQNINGGSLSARAIPSISGSTANSPAGADVACFNKGMMGGQNKMPWDISSKRNDKRKYLVASTSHTEAIAKQHSPILEDLNLKKKYDQKAINYSSAQYNILHQLNAIQ